VHRPGGHSNKFPNLANARRWAQLSASRIKMAQTFLTLEYFKTSLIDAFFDLPDIMGDSTHPQYENLQNDIKNINTEDLELFVAENNIDRFIERFEDKDLQKRRFYLIEKIRNQIAIDKIDILLRTDLSLPYSSNNLRDLSILENSLVLASDFLLYGSAFKYGDYIYHLCTSTDASNSSYWIAEAIAQLIRKRNIKFKVRLDPFVEKHTSDYSPMFYKMTVYGTKLDWEKLLDLKEDEHGRWMSERQDTQWTDYVWRPEKDEIHFTCEELPSLKDILYRGSRYFHAIFDKQTGLIKHCDGAIRIYNRYEYEERLKFHIRNAEVRKTGKRIKLFQVDETIDKFDFMKLITSFMVWNHDVYDYFN